MDRWVKGMVYILVGIELKKLTPDRWQESCNNGGDIDQ